MKLPSIWANEELGAAFAVVLALAEAGGLGALGYFLKQQSFYAALFYSLFLLAVAFPLKTLAYKYDSPTAGITALCCGLGGLFSFANSF